MKKYLSCVILILLCLICAMVFYANASPIKPLENGGTTTAPDNANTDNPGGTSTTVKPTRIPVIEKNGTILGEYYTDSYLRVEWSVYKYLNENVLYLSAELYLDSDVGMSTANPGYIEINGEKTEFKTELFSGGTKLLSTVTKTIKCEKEALIHINAHIDASISDSNGVNLSGLDASGVINATEEYKSMDSSKLLSVTHISQYPSLPSGDEITALGIVLKYLNYQVDINDLCDLYLSKGPVGFTSFYEANVGNPRSQYNSYGCYAPVIIDAGNRFIQANGGNSVVTDMTGYNPDELYRQVSKGNPIIVWVCEDFEVTPSISRIWVVNGKTLYLKSNMACMVLIGYDYTRNTVTLSDPAGGIFSIDMELFELRYAQMGSQAIMIR
ncbi:MAG: C39 family peptidase [Clostridia bacterium]|nr:C39 family peptidase [Clostridia bacterium]